MRKWTGPFVFFAISCLTLGCETRSPTNGDELKQQPPAASPAPPAKPAPAPTTTTTTAPPPPPANRPPTVTIRGGGKCHPSAQGSEFGAQSCFVTFTADARDPDGDALTYSWTGCTSGSEPQSVCLIPTPGDHTATVTVRDEHRGQATASKSARGTNAAPVAKITFAGSYPSNYFYSSVDEQPEDPDGDEYTNILCKSKKLTVSGPCRAAFGLCGGVSYGLDIELHTETGPGVCTLTVKFTDSWGAVGRATATFLVEPP